MESRAPALSAAITTKVTAPAGPFLPGPRSPLSHKQGGGCPADTTRATGTGVGSDPVPALPHARTGAASRRPPDGRSPPSRSPRWHTSPRGCRFRRRLSRVPPPLPRCRTPGSDPPSSEALHGPRQQGAVDPRFTLVGCINWPQSVGQHGTLSSHSLHVASFQPGRKGHCVLAPSWATSKETAPGTRLRSCKNVC